MERWLRLTAQEGGQEGWEVFFKMEFLSRSPKKRGALSSWRRF